MQSKGRRGRKGPKAGDTAGTLSPWSRENLCRGEVEEDRHFRWLTSDLMWKVGLGDLGWRQEDPLGGCCITKGDYRLGLGSPGGALLWQAEC